MTEADLSFDERRDHGDGPTELTMPPAESIREALTPDTSGAVATRYNAGPGARLTGERRLADRLFRRIAERERIAARHAATRTAMSRETC